VTTLTRWKLSCALFAALAGGAMWKAHRADAGHNAPAKLAAAPRGTLPIKLRRPIHVSPDAIGISQRELVDRILGAKSVKDIQLLAEKLGAVGDDDAVEMLSGLLTDTRKGVPEAMLSAFGNIGTQRAVDILAEHTKDDRPTVRYAAINGLGATHSERGRTAIPRRAWRSTRWARWPPTTRSPA
jgi:hypothetical protein